MKRFIFLFLILSTSFLFSDEEKNAAPINANEETAVNEANKLIVQTETAESDMNSEEADMDALRKWIHEKRMISIKELGGDLSLSGETRVEMQASSEKHNGRQVRGPHKDQPRPTVAFDLEVNLMLDYRTDNSWTSIKLEFDNDMGIFHGSGNHINLEKAYVGARLYSTETFTIDGSMGRQPLFNLFDSKVEFASNCDGVSLRLSKAYENIGDLYTTTAIFLINDKGNHFGYVGELGMLHISHSGLYAKYSLIDWKKHYENPIKRARFDFLVSQILLGYQIDGRDDTWWKLVKLYLAGLMNHFAEGRNITLGEKENLGWYIGAAIGQVKKKGDFAFEMSYQWVQAQMCPDFDAFGIKRGNAFGVGFYTKKLDGSGGRTNIHTAVGGCNYKGFIAELLYAISNNFTMLQNIQFSQNENKHIGPFIKWFQYEIEFIYAF